MLELALLASLQQQTPPRKPESSYLILVASEGFNQVAMVRFGPSGGRIEHRTLIRLPSVDSVNPRGLRVSPDGRQYYVTTAHGFPNGELLRFRIAGDSTTVGPLGDTLRGREPLDPHPGAIQVTADGAYAWITSETPISDRQPSWIAVVYLPQMVEVTRIATCASPRGGQLSGDGAHHYSVCSQDDALVEIDVAAMKVSRRLVLPAAAQRRCGAAGLANSSDGSRVFVACEQSNEVMEIDARTWSVLRRIPVGTGPGAVAATRDGRTLVVTNRGSQTVSLVDLATGRMLAQPATALVFSPNFVVSAGDRYPSLAIGRELARLVARRRMPVSVVLSPDDRYAFVSVTSTGTEPGAVNVIDLAAHAVVATIEVGRGAGAIDFWRMATGKAPN